MSTQLHISPESRAGGRPKLQRIFDWILDIDGDMYGDERERLRWYEGIAISTSLQWILIPWMLAVMAWICPSETAPYLWAFWAVSTVPQYVTLFYASRSRVNVTAITWNRKRLVVTAVTIMPLFIFLVGMTVGIDIRESRDVSIGSLVGGTVGGAVGLLLVVVLSNIKKRRDARRLASIDETDPDRIG